MTTPIRHVCVLVALGLILAPATFAGIHFSVVRSTPAPGEALGSAPKRLQIWFSQVPAPGVSQITLAGVDKKNIALGKAAIDKDAKSMFVDVAAVLAPGPHTLTWRAAGDDGHVMTGEIKFTVATPTATEAAGQADASGNCVTIGRPKPALVYTMRHAESTGAVTQVTNQWDEVTEKGSRVRINAPAGRIIYVNEHRIVDDVAVFDKMSKLSEGGAPIDSTTFKPGLVGDPVFRACAGRSWTIPSVAATYQSSRTSASAPTPVGTLRIIAIREKVTVPAGTFDTVHYIRTSQSTDEYWKSIEHGVVVKHIGTLATGAVTDVLLSIK